MSTFKSGFVSIIGRANAGKSTLLNKFLKQKVSIVSPKPQTTRNKIIGILNDENYQIVFIDTPGIHKIKNTLDKYMDTQIKNSLTDIDLLLYLIDGTKDFSLEELQYIERLSLSSKLILVVTKIDDTTMERLYPQLNKLNDITSIKDIIPISSYKGKNIDVLINEILKYLPNGVAYYPKDEVTDKNERFMASEIIREKALYLLQQEIPHGIAVLIDKFDESGDNLYRISATIICEKENHKSIIIGNNGSMLKAIGEKARLELENIFGKKVFLELWVKVKPKWRDSDIQLSNMGYNKKID